MAERTVDVLVPVAVNSPYSYRIPADLALAPGDLVAVPLGSRRVIGSVWPSQKEVPAQTKLKAISAKLDFPPLPQELMRLVDWVADYTLAPRGMVLRMALRFDAELGEGRARIGVRLAGKAAAAHDRGARTRDRASCGRSRAAESRGGEGSGRVAGRRRRLDRRGNAASNRASARADRAAARCRFRPAGIERCPGRAPPKFCARRFAPTTSRSICSTASPAPARPKSISRRSRRR